MRSKVVLLLLLAGAVIAAGLLLKHPTPKPVAETKPAPVNAPAPAPVPVAVAAPAPAPARKAMTADEHQRYISEERNRLSSWAMNDDSQSLSNILADLYSPDPEIRMAAIEAAKQFESTNAIPVLKAAAANDDNTEEAIAMLQAANWLATPTFDPQPHGALPTLTPQQQQQMDASRAAAQARWQQNQLKKTTRIPTAPGAKNQAAGNNNNPDASTAGQTPSPAQ